MSLLTRYIARLYLLNILTLLVVLFSFVIVVDIVVNLDRYAGTADQVMRAGAEGPSALRKLVLTVALIFDLWLPRLLQLFVSLTGVVLIAAMGFTCAQLVRHRELLAMLAGGLSLHRAARPFLLVGLVFVGLQALVQEKAIPPVAHLLTRDAGEGGRREIGAFAVRLGPDAAGRLWYAAQFDTGARTLKGLYIWERDERTRLVRVIRASAATWDGSAWELQDGQASSPVAGADGQAPAPRPVSRLETSLDPDRLSVRYVQGFADNLSWGQIGRLVDGGGLDDRSRARLDRVRWARPASHLCTLLALWASLACFLRREPSGLIFATLKAAPIALAGFGAGALAALAPVPGLPPWGGALLPCVVLAAIALALSSAVET